MTRATLRKTVLAGSLMALALAAPARADDRLLAHAYSESEVVRIDGKAGVQATIAFGEGEAIENVAVGDSQAWQITPNKRADLLFVKPLEATARTNMTVVTNRHTYFFDLVASTKAKPLYMLRFTYKDEPKPQAAPAAAGLDASEVALALGDPSAVPADPAALNFAWKRVGSEKLLPSRIYDDGQSTYLLWPEQTSVPAILVTNEKGDEGPVNYAVRGATIVIDDVPNTLILRSGKTKAELVNTLPLASRPAKPLSQPAPVAPAAAPTVAANSPAPQAAPTVAPIAPATAPTSQGN
ncbi:TrbG/VirB9 family P-type conjugative transfer protein [Novosphingobium resinovorum]|uniref:TrbG/VirB9 family P-type conjugative transfer protein n=1 Tax=Novosphingobium TaxID=165696 RepID=UPI001B3C96D2|nr:MULTISPECIES: TrbG/VirB9 family P-type conjugative transfer protein [Novosphingobium]MBF7012411.1 TrbG/VirB9 family P-type conjugative transfer protein [Novosphingobium sp. HR1a]WJM27151.1 TrbG/VirB9 family P-type conjugative transfer protein [Novosphingobium resinovorum]